MIAREAALKAIGEYRRTNRVPTINLKGASINNATIKSDIALANSILNGVIQNLAYCDYIASSYSNIALKKLHPKILDILRLSIYQLVFLTRVPSNAIVDEGVKLAKKYSNPSAASFVNAVLRKISQSIAENIIPEPANSDEIVNLSIKYSHPQWLVSRYCERLGIKDAVSLMEINNSSTTAITAQVNTLLSDLDSVMESLENQGIKALKHKWLHNCVELFNPGKINELDVFLNGSIYIQDAASKLAVLAAAPAPGDYIIDACSSPGGKSFAAAISMENTGHILACDLNQKKLIAINEGQNRLNITIVETSVMDGSTYHSELMGKADVVLADVPCSGIGVIRKKPDIRYKDPITFTALTNLQKSILSNVSKYVKVGGILLYSTCTVLEEENEEIVNAFLDEHPEFSPVSFELPEIGNVSSGMITLWPHKHGTDGFFICKMRRN
ncbi:MAG: 16S rRNA (cytosine(967)-C(5))-methyltransferase RsmB [Oscillospiraceae bacterium]|nr:16S rRNA (cytosine(967)-C(5))-methyltransferase RsmB [Oscillospiraceae bacterium]